MSLTVGQRFVTWAKSPTGLFTTHFWGPVANWGFVLAGIADTKKPAEHLSPNMTGVMCIYSLLFMRFAWVIQPRNYLLLACHASNETVQLYQFSRWARWYMNQPKETKSASAPADMSEAAKA